ncbi:MULTISPECIES: hypothetical protein [Trichocoleus]|uniref:Uncharacterized protein n=1 Tax=Trichocoleus desertorum GB2-A4 TaxID=2933944 RepID=A0ABV0J163_9CYAN|nr:hypothetical protein [Trichocoleus sp. FACHB-46]MBD1860131.1 hypothetical protein [Trichocoleus sp. FACHB-46]
MASHNKLLHEGVPGSSGHSLAWEVMVVLACGLGIWLVMMVFFVGVVV